ncbi:hypothetical protein D3C72_1148670 [compost metagenome]
MFFRVVSWRIAANGQNKRIIPDARCKIYGPQVVEFLSVEYAICRRYDFSVRCSNEARFEIFRPRCDPITGRAHVRDRGISKSV